MNPASLSRQEAQSRIDSLRQQIDHHDYLYYVEDQPSIPDVEYDLSLIHI